MISLDTADTIAAIASPRGAGLRGIARLGGPDAWRIALDGFEPDGASPWPPPRRSRRYVGRHRVDGLRPLLPSAVVLWPAPRTYTRQDLAEIHTVAAPPLLEALLAQLLRRGARLATPGEFTLRAFLSGRIDLTRAEAVLGVIDAHSPGQLQNALEQLAGGLASSIASLRERLLDILAHLEANLDFVEEADVDDLGRDALADGLSRASEEILDMARRLSQRNRPEGHPRVVLAGPPNAGKSRLFNALLGDARALVSPLAGTTRDYLSGICDCNGLTIELIDTAGEDEARTSIERQAQAHRQAQSSRADLILQCQPADALSAPHDLKQSCLIVTTKSDLSPLSEPAPPNETGHFRTSAATGEGLAGLRQAIGGVLRAKLAEDNAATQTGVRCRDGLARAGESLAWAAQALLLGGGDELVAIDIRQAIDDLGRVTGAVVDDEILDRIFRRFCIGK